MPISAQRGKSSSPGQAAADSALWHDHFGASNLPPPPSVFTLEDRSDFSLESWIPDHQMSLEIKSDPKIAVQRSGRDFSTPLKRKLEGSTSYAVKIGQHTQQKLSGSPSWWFPVKGSGESDDKANGSPVEGVVQPCALAILPPPREVAGPQMQTNALPVGTFDEEEWVTVYGFSPGDTNSVLWEFEKCGVILKHIPGPRDANWMHILYQNRSAAQKALSKNGMQINAVLIVGVKPVDPVECQALNERLNNNDNNQGFMLVAPL